MDEFATTEFPEVMFILELTYRDGALDQLDRWIPEHYEYIDRHLATGEFLMSGRKVPRTGGVILAQGMDRATIEQLVTEDPFHREDLAEYTITEVQPTRSLLAQIAA
ncbi:YciI family protein [Nocardia sp. NBC_01388]|uniref:YciI family protein n=1 Tax=Nocardia sp. NBC_01388 TaxID=2903596 RepID=UPI00324E8519